MQIQTVSSGESPANFAISYPGNQSQNSPQRKVVMLFILMLDALGLTEQTLFAL